MTGGDNVQFVDDYELLQIGPKAEFETLQRVYRILAGRRHPDDPNAARVERFLRLKQADQEYKAKQSLPVETFNVQDLATAFDGESTRRMGLLSLLYRRCRVNPDEPGLPLSELEHVKVSARQHLLFTVWYLEEKGLLRQIEDSSDALSSSGANDVEHGLTRNKPFYGMLKAAGDESLRFSPYSSMAEPDSSVSSPDGPFHA